MPLFLTSHEKKALMFVGALLLSGTAVFAWRHFHSAPAVKGGEQVRQRIEERDHKFDKKPARPSLDLNAATEQELLRVPTVGRVTAARIVQYRRLNGPFRDVAELDRVPGIGGKRLGEIRPYVFVTQDPTPAPRASRPGIHPSTLPAN
jgi:competence ComEA-like helix-hairpin-helix protein